MGIITPKSSLLYLIIFLLSNIISAQTLDLQTIPSNKMQYGFSFNKPFISGNANMTFLSGNYSLSLNIPVSSKLNIIGKIPFVNTSYEYDYFFGKYSYSENGFGNIFVGLQTNSQIVNNEKSVFSFGFYLPTASETFSFYGALTDYYYYSEYIPNTFSFYFNYAFHKLNAQGFNYGLEIGPNLLIPTKKNNSEAELLAHYGILTGYQINKLLLNVEFTGIAIITEDIENFGDRFVNMVNIGAQWKESVVTPKIFYKIYLRSEIRHNIDGILSIGVNVSIK